MRQTAPASGQLSPEPGALGWLNAWAWGGGGGARRAGCSDREPMLPGLCKATERLCARPQPGKQLLHRPRPGLRPRCTCPGWGVAEHSQAWGRGTAEGGEGQQGIGGWGGWQRIWGDDSRGHGGLTVTSACLHCAVAVRANGACKNCTPLLMYLMFKHPWDFYKVWNSDQPCRVLLRHRESREQESSMFLTVYVDFTCLSVSLIRMRGFEKRKNRYT